MPIRVPAANVTACTGGPASDGPRIVSVSKQINEFTYDVGGEKELVARSHVGVSTGHYAAAVGGIPSRALTPMHK